MSSIPANSRTFLGTQRCSIQFDKKDTKMLNSVQVGLKKHSSLSRSKFDNMRSILKIKKPTSHFEDHLRSDVAGVMPISHFDNHLRSDVSHAVSLITEPELKTTKRDFKRSSESESNIHDDGDNIMIFSSYIEENMTQLLDTCIILEHSMSEK